MMAIPERAHTRPSLEERLHPVLDQLITLYARHGVQGVQNSSAFQRLCDAQTHEATFHIQRMRVERAQARLEARLRAQTPREQVVQALKVMRRPADDEAKRLYRELVARGFAGSWSPAQQTYFQAAARKVQEWDDYFLSFTAHNPDRPNPSLLNIDYEILLLLGSRKELTVPESANRNLVAELVHARLRGDGLRGYFYPEWREEGKVALALTDRASRCFAFVQLVELTLFQRFPNYCQLEFNAARVDPSQALVFVLTRPYDEFVAMEDDVHDELVDWYEVLVERQGVPFAPAQTHDAALEVLRVIKTDIAQRIRDAGDRLYDGVPS
jgi:hypothetical protein